MSTVGTLGNGVASTACRWVSTTTSISSCAPGEKCGDRFSCGTFSNADQDSSEIAWRRESGSVSKNCSTLLADELSPFAYLPRLFVRRLAPATSPDGVSGKPGSKIV